MCGGGVHQSSSLLWCIHPSNVSSSCSRERVGFNQNFLPPPCLYLLLGPFPPSDSERSSTGTMECWEAPVTFLSWALIVGGVAYLWHQTRDSPAEYGRYALPGNRGCSARLAWFLQEVPAFLLPLLLLLFTGEPRTGSGRSTGRTLLLCTFMLHYFHRSDTRRVTPRSHPHHKDTPFPH